MLIDKNLLVNMSEKNESENFNTKMLFYTNKYNVSNFGQTVKPSIENWSGVSNFGFFYTNYFRGDNHSLNLTGIQWEKMLTASIGTFGSAGFFTGNRFQKNFISLPFNYVFLLFTLPIRMFWGAIILDFGDISELYSNGYTINFHLGRFASIMPFFGTNLLAGGNYTLSGELGLKLSFYLYKDFGLTITCSGVKNTGFPAMGYNSLGFALVHRWGNPPFK